MITGAAVGADGRPWAARVAEAGGRMYSADGPSVVGVVSAGNGRADHYQPQDADPLRWPAGWEAVEIDGISAYPVAYPGQLALIDTSRAAKPDQLDAATLIDLHDNLVLIHARDRQGRSLAYLKRICHDPEAPGGYVIASVDSGRSSPYLPPERIDLIVPVVGIIFEDPRRPRQKGRAAARIVIP